MYKRVLKKIENVIWYFELACKISYLISLLDCGKSKLYMAYIPLYV